MVLLWCRSASPGDGSSAEITTLITDANVFPAIKHLCKVAFRDVPVLNFIDPRGFRKEAAEKTGTEERKRQRFTFNGFLLLTLYIYNISLPYKRFTYLKLQRLNMVSVLLTGATYIYISLNRAEKICSKASEEWYCTKVLWRNTFRNEVSWLSDVCSGKGGPYLAKDS